ncbi:hypothetical protein AAVH_25011 [Aphelenchoides avenae]|nr:hypothetical protein AAVH_25011 [Aphelenchus avenae]
MSDATAASRFVDWFLAATGEDREVRFVQGSAGTAEVVRVLYDQILLQEENQLLPGEYLEKIR